MNNRGVYTLFFLVVLMLQVFVLNNLGISSRIAPLIYMVLIVMLPLELSQLSMLAIGFAIGVLMDITMGTCGLNLMVTLPLAVFRRPIINIMAGFSDFAKTDGVPSPARLGRFMFHRYVITMLVLHLTLFFVCEWLASGNFGFFVARYAASTLLSLVLSYLLIYIFIPKLAPKK